MTPADTARAVLAELERTASLRHCRAPVAATGTLTITGDEADHLATICRAYLAAQEVDVSSLDGLVEDYCDAEREYAPYADAPAS